MLVAGRLVYAVPEPCYCRLGNTYHFPYLCVGHCFVKLNEHCGYFHNYMPLGFINTYQWVNPCLPVRCPNSGRMPHNSNTSATFTCVSFHLNTRTPSSSKTRKHSEKPDFKSSRQPFGSLPYFFASQLFSPDRIRCGGSKTTNLKVQSLYGRLVKSRITSGSILNVRPSQSTCVSDRMSPNTTSSLCLSSQNMRLPQQGSRTLLFVSMLIAIRNINLNLDESQDKYYAPAH